MPTLALRLKSETRALHTSAERSAFMRALLRGQMSLPAYVALLRNLHAIYAALEPALLRQAQRPTIAPVLLPALWRGPSLVADLDALHGPSWAANIALQPATDAYVNRVRELDASAPDLLLAHAYVRYLGDLSGGQMLRRIVAASMPVPAGRGTAFYEFGDAEQTHALTQAFRNGLARVVADPATVSALADEARRAFELHSRLFDELARAFKLGDEPAAEPVVAAG